MTTVLHANSSLISCLVMLSCHTVQQNHHPDPFPIDDEQHHREHIQHVRLHIPQPFDQRQKRFLAATLPPLPCWSGEDNRKKKHKLMSGGG